MSLFLGFAELCDALAATTKKLEKRALIADYLHSLPVDDAGRAALWLAGTPFAETDSRVLNIGGALLQKAIAQLAAATPTALGAAYRRTGDIGAAAADLLYGHAPDAPTLTLAEVESAFAALAEARGPAPKLRGLLDLLARATPVEAKYLIKLATGDMRTGVKQSLVEEAIAEAWPPADATATDAPGAEAPQAVAPAASAVRRASMLLGDLRVVVALAAGGRLADARMKLFHPLGFMLASPVQSPEEAVARFTEEIQAELGAAANTSGKESSVMLREASISLRPPSGRNQQSSREPNACPERSAERRGVEREPAFRSSVLKAAQLEDKYDGIRAQLHVEPQAAGDARVALYSRNRDDLSASFPELTEAFAAIQESAILDGEILAWNSAISRALPFSTLQQRLGRKRVTAEMRRDLPVVLVVFDLLFRGDQLLLDQPLSERRTILEDFCARWSPATAALASTGQTTLFSNPAAAFPRLILAPAARLASAEDLDRAWLEARVRGNEGVMIKSLASLYQPGRRGLAWLKLKRELATLDVVVTGVEYGNGRRAAVLSDYTFAIRDPDDAEAPLKNVGKAYTGLTDQEIADMTAWFKAHTLVDYGPFRTVEPNVILEVAFNNVMRSSRHASGFALRFPRILRIRQDKPVGEIDTLRRVEEIFQSQPDKPVDES
ncbi:MAG: ATP-dependent DNA ligase [Acidobacteriaceae bacterium]